MRRKDFDITSKVSMHDVHQFEVKLEYNLEKLQDTNNYRIQTCFFIPRAVNINQFTYPKDEFFSDLNNYIRFKTPSYSFKLILDPHFKRSPLYILNRIAEEMSSPSESSDIAKLSKQAIKECKLLACMVKARLEDFELFVNRKLNKADKDENYIIRRLEEGVVRGIRILEEFRELKSRFSKLSPAPKELLNYFQIVEEFLSYMLEEEFIGIMKKVRQEIPTNARLSELDAKFKEGIKAEIEYRRKNNFKLIFNKDENSKENYIYQMGQYKKIVSSVLYLRTIREQKNTAYFQIVGSAAAFVASLLYFFITYQISKRVAIDSTWFIVLVSFGYVFKDRIKEGIKIAFQPHLIKSLPDQDNDILDSTEGEQVKLGRIREWVYFTNRSKVNPILLELRDRNSAEIFPGESPEEILVFQKEINIDTETVMKRHSRTINFTDIMRFNIQKYLLRMDNPEQPINYFDEDLGQSVSTIGSRVYHIYLGLQYAELREDEEKIRFELYRIVASKWGIKRIEFVEER